MNPAYSVSTFFFLMFLILICSTLSFTLLNYAPVSILNRNNEITVNTTTLIDNDKLNLTSAAATTNEYERVNLSYTSLSSLMAQKSGQIDLFKRSLSINPDENDMQEEEQKPKMNQKEKALLLITSMLVSFVIYGILPAFQSYSTLPYGYNVYHLAINLSE